MKWTVKRYVTARGKNVIDAFIKDQDRATQSKILRLIGLIEVYGPDLGQPHARYLGGKLYELCVRGKNEIRIFYVGINNQNVVVLLHVFKKKTQRLPEREIKIARNRQKTLT